MSRGVNFPALVLDYPLRHEDDAIYQRNSDFTLIWIAPRNIGFFFGIVLFWYWVEWELDENRGRSSRASRPGRARIAGLWCGVVFGILTGAYAVQMVASKWRPETQIGAFGIVWSIVLITYFSWQLTRELRVPA